MGLLAKKFEYGLKSREFFNLLVEREIYQKKFGYLSMFMDDPNAKYRNNLASEDGLNFETVFMK